MVSKNKRARQAKARAATDAAYRKMLGVADDEALPTSIGQASSGGAARGGRGGARKGSPLLGRRRATSASRRSQAKAARS